MNILQDLFKGLSTKRFCIIILNIGFGKQEGWNIIPKPMVKEALDVSAPLFPRLSFVIEHTWVDTSLVSWEMGINH